MATKASKPAPVTPAGPAVIAQPAADLPHPPVSAFVTLWVYRRAVAAVNNQVGFVRVARADAQALIDADQAVDPATTHDPLPYIEGTAPLGWPRRAPEPPPVPPPAPGPSPSPPPAGPSVTLYAFTATDPATAMLSSTHSSYLSNGTLLRLHVVSGGDAAANAALEGAEVTVSNWANGGTTISLSVDLSAASVSGLTVSATLLS
jgi:hypothetical protein